MKLVTQLRLENLERLVREMGTLEKVAEAAETSGVYLSQLRRGALDLKTGKPRQMGHGMARRLESGCGKTVGWMDVDHDIEGAFVRTASRDTIEDDRPSGETPDGTALERRTNTDRRYVGKVALAVMDVKASMGHGALRPSHESVVMNMVVDENWLRRHATFSSPENLSLVTGIGDSMQPTFEDGDPLLVDRGVTDIRLDSIYVLSLKDELYIKRVQRNMDGSLVIISDNPKYRPQEVSERDRGTFQVLGRVVMAWNSRRI